MWRPIRLFKTVCPAERRYRTSGIQDLENVYTPRNGLFLPMVIAGDEREMSIYAIMTPKVQFQDELVKP